MRGFSATVGTDMTIQISSKYRLPYVHRFIRSGPGLLGRGLCNVHHAGYQHFTPRHWSALRFDFSFEESRRTQGRTCLWPRVRLDIDGSAVTLPEVCMA
jgi:hypothetical protein